MAQSADVISHWHLLVDDFNTSALEFYTAIEAAVAARKVPDVTVSRVDGREGGILSAKREYLRIGRDRLTFDICAAPYGTSYFFSWWFAEQPPQFALLYMCMAIFGLPIAFVLFIAMFGFGTGILLFLAVFVGVLVLLRNSVHAGAGLVEDIILAMPYIGTLYQRLFKPITYYATDTHIMFQESIHRAVVESIEAVRTTRGLRALSPDETRPTMRDILR